MAEGGRRKKKGSVAESKLGMRNKRVADGTERISDVSRGFVYVIPYFCLVLRLLISPECHGYGDGVTFFVIEGCDRFKRGRQDTKDNAD